MLHTSAVELHLSSLASPKVCKHVSLHKVAVSYIDMVLLFLSREYVLGGHWLCCSKLVVSLSRIGGLLPRSLFI